MSLKLKDLYVRRFSTCLLVSLLALIPKAATAQTLGFDFAVTPQVSTTGEAPLEWYTDRYAPCTFSGAANKVLTESVCASGYQTPTPSFSNTQGNKFDLLAGTNSLSILLYVPESWELLPERLAGFWATAVNSSYAVGNDYPIIEFQGPIVNEVPGPSFYPNGGVAGFYGWNNISNSFAYIGLPTSFRYNSWVKLTMTLTGGQFTYTVANSEGNDGVSLSSPLYDSTESYLGNVILEGYNYDAPYSIEWKLLKFSFDSNGQIVWN
ncbi:MAG: hypothetical protein WCC95_01545 [Candidatus Sulfotelmatobacter sp.]|jgi:hypothetical protein